jgi:protein SCO1
VIVSSLLIVIAPTLFSKNLARVEINKEISLDLILQSNKNVELLFFGYTGCIDICSPRLQSLSNWYASLPQSIKNSVQVSFIDLSTPDHPSTAQAFVSSFHPEFKSIFLDAKTLRSYTRAFDVYFASSLFDNTEIDHTTHLYLLSRDNQKKMLNIIYTAYPYDYAQLTSDVQGKIDE